MFDGLALMECFGGSQVVDLLDAGRGNVSWKDITEDRLFEIMMPILGYEFTYEQR